MQPFLISEFSTGINNYLEPWIRTKDAFDPLQNAYTYRGTLQKRTGYSVYGNRLADHNPVMGIMQRIDESNGNITLVVGSTRNLYSYNVGTNQFDAITSVSLSPFWIGTATGAGNVLPTFFPNLVPGTVHITDGATVIDDNGAGAFNSTGIFAPGGTINYTTGVVTLNFTGTTANTTLKVTATTANYFTGNNTNFFHYITWQPTDSSTTESTSYLYITNNVDPVTLYDGTSLSRPIYYLDIARTIYITRTLDVNVYKNRLLFFRPTFSNSSQTHNQSIYFSAQFNPFDFQQTPGHGGFLAVPTGDIFIAEEYLRDAIIMFFTNSTWIFRFSGIVTDPFRVDKLSGAKRHNVPYGTVAYDERVTSLGSTGFTACDGVNVQRYDNNIIEFYEENISEQFYNQCFSQRYDNLNQTWMLYVSNQTPFPAGSNAAPGADSALVYNFLENSFATYRWSVPMTCLGIYFTQTGATWASTTTAWEKNDLPWFSYSRNKLAPILLSGDVDGNVYWQDNQAAIKDNETSFEINCTTTRWNPIMQTGQKVQFPYIDIYYSVASVDPDNPVVLTLNFMTDNSPTVVRSLNMTLDGTGGSEFYFKRIYCNVIGQFLRMNIDPPEDSYFKILGFVVWAEPAGRLTP